ncbi:MAG: glycoside hydrolase family 31 protein [Candidatus Ozemobacteraceae bacterium]
MKRILFTLFAVCVCSSVFGSGFEFVGNVVTVQRQNENIDFKLSNALLRVSVLDENIVRFRYVRNKFSEAPSYAVEKPEVPFLKEYLFKENNDSIEIQTKLLSIKISKTPCRVTVSDLSGRLICQDEPSFGVSFDDSEVRCFKSLLPEEKFFGLGEKTREMERTGKEFVMWNSDTPAYTTKEDPIYESIPFFLGIREQKAYGIFFDNTYRSRFNMGASNKRFFWFGAEKGEMDYYLIYGPAVKQVVESYSRLTGKMPLPPQWALGFQQCKWSYFPEAKVRSVARTFRERGIPCDVLYLDIDYMDGYRVFTWDSKKFPRPAKLIDDLRKDGFKVVTIVDPGVKAGGGQASCEPKNASFTDYFIAREGIEKSLFAKYPDGTLYEGEVWPSWAYFPDFSKPATRQWWGDNLSLYLKEGVAGIWNDMNEPAVWGAAFPDIVQFDDNGHGADHKKIHNVYALEMAKATYEGIRRNSKKRPLVLTRAGYSGIQRYSAVWTGDNVASEEHLQLACRMLQSMGLSGIPFVGTDAGGFSGIPSADLFIRWLELGVFSPFFRAHSEADYPDKEPYAFGQKYENMAREVIKLRYKLLSFLYSEFYNASKTGLPIMRPMFLNFQDEEPCYSSEASNQFMVGENLLVAPVLKEKETFKKFYLPAGNWVDLHNGTIYEGQSWKIVEAPLDTIPLFLHEGGFLPTQAPQNYVGEKPLDELEMAIFPPSKGNSKYELYQDDGESYEFENGTYSLTNFTCAKEKGWNIHISRSNEKFVPPQKWYVLKIFNVNSVERVSLNETPISLINPKGSNIPTGYWRNEEDKTLMIKVPAAKDISIKVHSNR